jgi:hypothetical protein
MQMLYKKINVELIVVADQPETVVAELNAELDRLRERHTFWWRDETVAFEHRNTEEIAICAYDGRW